ncbi:Na/Pi cotransporter family protein [Natronogracilivirga saccharolytica]|uniref:Na/Pi cotransporter family protein n=1 Tax=Natronogracilivirga saccharolytica TaxID=2812953 RepID=A0A8J7RKT7_9BACT|nr:Na/Pi cotransporter family protein [Natronogracilivirga saccharolytica]MBP3191494.1 Na/Pi cotransporter family protein [Natronogracilivirga saccharolytica]
MTYTFFDFLQLIGSLGIFIYGMKIFSEGLQKVAGGRLRGILKGMTTNRVTGIATGFAATTVTQSSTTTTVMVVSFVNAGLLTFLESTGVIMGANIGTTVTAWMVSVFGFRFQITPVAVSLIGIFFPFLFVRNTKLRHVAEAMIGFGILFIGLEFIKDSVPDIEENPQIFAFLDRFTDYGFGSTLIFVMVGTLLTLITQSSSAATAITLVMLAQGWINFPIAAAMILGENIGTTITANIAALIGNVHAKRAARFHLFFNLIGVIWMLLMLPFFLKFVDYMVINFSPAQLSVLDDSPEARINATIGLSLFHTTFNVLNVLLLFGFVPLLIRLVIWLQPSRGKEDEQKTLKYISGGLMPTAELSIDEAYKEVEVLARVTEKISFSTYGLFFKGKEKHQGFLDKIKRREEITDRIELEVSQYLTNVTEFNLSRTSSRRVRSMMRMVNDLERIADLYYQISRTYDRMVSEGIGFPESALEEIRDMMQLVQDALQLMRENLAGEYGLVDMEKAKLMEEKIDALRDELRQAHFRRLERKDYDVRAGIYYLDFINRLEKVGDHVLNVNEASAGLK